MKRSMLTVDSAKPIHHERIDEQSLVPRLSHAPVLSNQQIDWQGLNFLEFNHPSYGAGEYIQKYHSVAISLSKGAFQELMIDGRSYSSIWNTGEVVIVPAESTRSVAWSGNLAFAALTFAPKLISEVASELIEPTMVELIPQLATPDPLIYQMALSLKQDVEARYPTGKLFGESAVTMLVA